MKKWMVLLVAAFLIGCVKPDVQTPGDSETPVETGEDSVVTEVKVIRAVDIFQPGGMLVVTMDPDHETLAVLSNEYTKDETVKPGDVLAVTHAGVFLESYPEQFGSVHGVEKVREEPDQTGLVTKIFDEFSESDPALVQGIQKIGVDLSQADNLSEIEKRAVLWHIGNKAEAELIEGTYDELVAQGHIDDEILAFEDGVFFEFIVNESNTDKTELNYDTRLWASGTGALYSQDVDAVWENGAWTLTGGSHFISVR